MADDKYIITLQKKYILALEEQLKIAKEELEIYKKIEEDKLNDKDIEHLFDR